MAKAVARRPSERAGALPRASAQEPTARASAQEEPAGRARIATIIEQSAMARERKAQARHACDGVCATLVQGHHPFARLKPPSTCALCSGRSSAGWRSDRMFSCGVSSPPTVLCYATAVPTYLITHTLFHEMWIPRGAAGCFLGNVRARYGMFTSAYWDFVSRPRFLPSMTAGNVTTLRATFSLREMHGAPEEAAKKGSLATRRRRTS